MATLTHAQPTSTTAPPLKTAGWLLLATIGIFVLYLVLAVTWGADYEQGAQDVAEVTGTTINTIPASEMARLTQEYETYTTLTGLMLFLPAAAFLGAIFSIRRFLGRESSLAQIAVWTAVGAAAVWYFYMVLNVGLAFDPDNLPPLTRDLDVLTVPLVAISGGLMLVATTLASLALRRAGVLRKTALVAAVVSTLLLVLGVAIVLGSNFDETIPPPMFAPAGLILAVGLLVTKAPASPVEHS
jgi:hypothetical protein